MRFGSGNDDRPIGETQFAGDAPRVGKIDGQLGIAAARAMPQMDRIELEFPTIERERRVDLIDLDAVCFHIVKDKLRRRDADVLRIEIEPWNCDANLPNDGPFDVFLAEDHCNFLQRYACHPKVDGEIVRLGGEFAVDIPLPAQQAQMLGIEEESAYRSCSLSTSPDEPFRDDVRGCRVPGHRGFQPSGPRS